MNKQEWKNYKKYGIGHLWECETNGWISALYDSKILKLHKLWQKMLKKMQNIVVSSYTKYYRLRFKLVKKPIIPVLEYVATTRCTMNCRNCNTLIPYYTDKTHVRPVSFEQYKSDLDAVLQSVDYINLFGFVGGEPLLNKDLAKMVEYACNQKQIKHVFIATNCTIIPNEELLQALKHPKIGIQISNYSYVKNLPKGVIVKHKEVKSLLEKNHIKISNPHEASHSNNWQTMPVLYPDLQDEKEVIKNYNCCYGRFCYMLSDGLILQCTACVYMVRNLQLTEEVKNELVDVRNAKTSKELTKNLIKFLSKPYSQFCHYCHFVDMKYGLPNGEQYKQGDVIRIKKIKYPLIH